MSTLFRKKNLDRINSPENLNEYIVVSNPRMWLVLAAVLMLLIGTVIWGIYGRMESVIEIHAMSEDHIAVCYVETTQIDYVHKGMPVRFDDGKGSVQKIEILNDDFKTARITMEANVLDGFHTGQIIVEQVPPISLLFN